MSTKRKCLPGNIKLKNLLLGPALLGGGHQKMPLNGSVRDPLIRGRRDKLATTFFFSSCPALRTSPRSFPPLPQNVCLKEYNKRALISILLKIQLPLPVSPFILRQPRKISSLKAYFTSTIFLPSWLGLKSLGQG